MNPDHPIGSSLSYWPKFLQRSALLEGKAGDDSLFGGGNSDAHKGVKGSDLLRVTNVETSSSVGLVMMCCMEVVMMY